MDRDMPVFNKVIMNRIKQKNMEIHYKHLINIRKSTKKSKLNSTSTSFYKPNSKTYQIEEQKKTEIDKNNIILFQKINNIVNRGKGSGAKLGQKLSSSKLMKQQDKIFQENKKLVERLANLKPTINNKKFMQQRRKQVNLLKFIGKYSPNKTNNQASLYEPYKIRGLSGGQNQRVRVKTQVFKDDLQEQMKAHSNWNMSMAIRPRYNTNSKFKPSPKAQNSSIRSSLTKYNQSPKHQNKSIILFKCIRKIGISSYYLSIIRTHDNYEIAAEEMCEEGKRFKISLGEEKGKSILQYIDYDYERLIQNLIIEDGLAMPQQIVEVKKEAKLPPQVNKKKISQMILPSHITQLNEEELRMQDEDGMIEKNNQSCYASSEDETIMNTFLSFGGNQ